MLEEFSRNHKLPFGVVVSFLTCSEKSSLTEVSKVLNTRVQQLAVQAFDAAAKKTTELQFKKTELWENLPKITLIVMPILYNQQNNVFFSGPRTIRHYESFEVLPYFIKQMLADHHEKKPEFNFLDEYENYFIGVHSIKPLMGGRGCICDRAEYHINLDREAAADG